KPFRPLQAIAFRIDADKGTHLQHAGGAHDLDHQIGADIARADDGGFEFAGLCCGHENGPIQAMVSFRSGWLLSEKTNSSPGFIGNILVKAPEMMTSPGWSETPNSPSLLASQAADSAGLPNTAAPSPSPAGAPFCVIFISKAARSLDFRLLSHGP